MKRYVLAMFVLTCCIATVSAQVVTTVAGSTLPAGFSGDGGPATLAQLNSNRGMAIDGAGNMYVADFGNNRVRKISASGVISTFAGSGISGYGGDGGPATAAWLGGPTAIAVYGSDVYIADAGNSRIRKVDAAGIISTVAGNGTGGSGGDGGAATLASISSPNGVWVDATGNIFIPDQSSNKVRKVSSAGIITTIAGTGVAGMSGDGGPATAAQLNIAYDVSVDAAGNVFISDLNNNRTRKVNTSGIISTVVGSGVYGLTGDGGPATSATLRGPMGIDFDGAGAMFVCDADNHVIRKVNASGVITTVAGVGTAGAGGDGGVPLLAHFDRPVKAVYWGGSLYVSDQNNNRIRKITFGNNPPHFSGGPLRELWLCHDAPPANIDTQLSAGDPDIGQTLSWSVIAPPVHGVAAVSYSVTSTGTVVTPAGLTYVPAAGYSGIDSFKVRIADGLAADTTTVRVNVLAGPTAGTISGPMELCVGAVTSITSTVPGGIWTTTNAHASVSGGMISGISAGVDTVRYSVSYSCGTATATLGVTVNPLPDAGVITGDSAVCVGSSIVLSASAGGGTWSSSNAKATVSPGGVVGGLIAGIDTIRYTVLNMCGMAAAVKVIAITGSLPDPGVIGGGGRVCEGSSITLHPGVSGGTWATSSATVALVGTSGIVTGKGAGVCTISYTVTNPCGAAIATKSITVDPLPPVAAITGPQRVCIGAMLLLSDTTPGGTWNSSNPGVANIGSASGLLTAVTAGVTIITYAGPPNGYGCSGTVTVTLTVLATAPFAISKTVTPLNCFGDRTGAIVAGIAGATGPLYYLWSTGDSGRAVYDLVAGNYRLRVTDSVTQCKADYSFTLTQPDQLKLTHEVTNDFCHAGSGTVSIVAAGGTPPYSYAWADNGIGSKRDGLHSGTYVALVTDINSCKVTDTSLVRDDTCRDVWVHNVITPNADGINDVWVIEQIAKYPDNSVAVFDKWGSSVYSKKGYNNDWSGVGSRGALLPDGTYYYVVKLNTGNAFGGNDVFTGSLLIKR